MGGFVRQFGGIEKPALRKLDMLHQVRDLNDLRAPPANRLEALSGDRRDPDQRSMAYLLRLDERGT